MSVKRVSPAILPPLKEALTLSFWYKPDLRAHLAVCLSNKQLVAQLDWTAYKRNIVGTLVDLLAAEQHLYFDDLLSLILSTADLTDPAHLKRLEDGERKYAAAVGALATLRKQVDPYRRMRDEEEEAERQREADRARSEIQQAVVKRLEELRQDFYRIIGEAEQQRGYSLELLLNGLFTLFDIDAKGPFRIRGEQIDGAFTLEGNEFLLEAKWQAAKTPTSDLDTFAGKINRKLDNTLGLFVSMNGYQETALELGANGRPVMVLMDGSDLSAVLEGRVELPQLLRRKRQHAAQTGEIYLSAYTILS
jgi:hypothetical protein